MERCIVRSDESKSDVRAHAHLGTPVPPELLEGRIALALAIGDHRGPGARRDHRVPGKRNFLLDDDEALEGIMSAMGRKLPLGASEIFARNLSWYGCAEMPLGVLKFIYGGRLSHTSYD